MKKSKLLIAILCIVMIFCCVFLAACNSDDPEVNEGPGGTTNNGGENGGNNGGGNNGGGNNGGNADHTHSYTASVTRAATCSVAGETKFTCSCGHSYTEPIAKIVHDYGVAISKYPTVTEKGTKTYTCKRSGCGYSYEEEIVALSARLPQVSKLIAPMFNNKNVVLKADDGAKVIFVRELDNYDHDYITDAYKSFLTIEVAESCFGGKGDVLAGYVKFKARVVSVSLDGSVSAVEVAEPTQYDELVDLELYVNGDTISVAFEEEFYGDKDAFEGTYNVYGLLASVIGKTVDLDENAVLGIVNAMMDMEAYAPLFEGIVTSAGALLMPDHLLENLDALADFLGDDIISETELEGDKTLFALDIGAIKAALAERADATVADIIDAQYGAGTTAAIAEILNDLPEMKLRDVATAAIAFAENYGVNIEETYELFNMYCYLIAGVEIDIAAELEQYYDKTVAWVLAEARGLEYSKDFVDALKEAITDVTETLPAFTADELYNLIVYGNSDYEIEGEVFSITDEILSLVAMMEENVEISATVGTVGEQLTILELRYDLGNVLVVYTFDGEGGYDMTLTMNGEKVFEGELTVTDSGAALNGTLKLNGETMTLNATVAAEALTLAIKHNGNDLLSANVTFDANGMPTAAEAKLYNFRYNTAQERYEYNEILAIELQKNGSGYEIDFVFENVTGKVIVNDQTASLLIKRGVQELVNVAMNFDAASGTLEDIAVKIYGLVYDYEEQRELYKLLIAFSFANNNGAYAFALESGDVFFEGTVELADNELSVSLDLGSVSREQTMAALDITVGAEYEAGVLTEAVFTGEFFIRTDGAHTCDWEVTLTATEINAWVKVEDEEFCTLVITTNGEYVVTGVDFGFNEALFGADVPSIHYAYDPATGEGEATLELVVLFIEVSFDEDSFVAEMFGRNVRTTGDVWSLAKLTVELDESGAPAEIALKITYPQYDPEQFMYVLSDELNLVYTAEADGGVITFAMPRKGLTAELSFDENGVKFVSEHSLSNDTIEIALKKVEGGVAFEWVMTMADDFETKGSIALTETENGVALDVDIPKLLLYMSRCANTAPSYPDPDWEAVLYTATSWMALDFTLLFEITDAQ